MYRAITAHSFIDFTQLESKVIKFLRDTLQILYLKTSSPLQLEFCQSFSVFEIWKLAGVKTFSKWLDVRDSGPGIEQR